MLNDEKISENINRQGSNVDCFGDTARCRLFLCVARRMRLAFDQSSRAFLERFRVPCLSRLFSPSLSLFLSFFFFFF